MLRGLLLSSVIRFSSPLKFLFTSFGFKASVSAIASSSFSSSNNPLLVIASFESLVLVPFIRVESSWLDFKLFTYSKSLVACLSKACFFLSFGWNFGGFSLFPVSKASVMFLIYTAYSALIDIMIAMFPMNAVRTTIRIA